MTTNAVIKREVVINFKGYSIRARFDEDYKSDGPHYFHVTTPKGLVPIRSTTLDSLFLELLKLDSANKVNAKDHEAQTPWWLGDMQACKTDEPANFTDRTQEVCECSECLGHGYSPEAKSFMSIFHQTVKHNLNEGDVLALIKAGHLKKITHYFSDDKQRVLADLNVPSPEFVMAYAQTNPSLFTSELVDVIMRHRLGLFKLSENCGTCGGTGVIKFPSVLHISLPCKPKE